ncbi:MAG: hypothetical protein AAGG79_07145, partial [Pseudomonadota bacterium]
MLSGEHIYKLSALWAWWKGEMVSLMPKPLRQRFGLEPSALILRASADAWGLAEERLGQDTETQHLGYFPSA